MTDGRTGRGEVDVKKECPGNKADKFGLSREHRMGAICWRVEVLAGQTEFDGEAVVSHRLPLIIVEMLREE